MKYEFLNFLWNDKFLVSLVPLAPSPTFLCRIVKKPTFSIVRYVSVSKWTAKDFELFTECEVFLNLLFLYATVFVNPAVYSWAYGAVATPYVSFYCLLCLMASQGWTKAYIIFQKILGYGICWLQVINLSIDSNINHR